jgi:hypothetical protein
VTVSLTGLGRQAFSLDLGGGSGASILDCQSGSELTVFNGLTVLNHGVLRGTGHIAAGSISTESGGEVRVAAGGHLLLSGNVTNGGRIEAIGTAENLAEIEFDSAVTNSAGTGSIVARNAMLRFGSGLTNGGALALSFGTTDVMGDVTNSASGTIAVAGNSGVTFYDDVTNSGTLNVASGSTAVFFGALAGNGNVGGGDVQALGDLLPGASPGTMQFGGNLTMGPLTNLAIEIAGTGLGQFDRLVVDGDAALAGALDVELDGFSLSLGQSFEIIDVAGALSGTFASLAEGATLGNFGGTELFITYAGGDGNDVALFAPGLPGDFNHDGSVDAADYVVWRKNPGGVYTPDDYTAWRANFGATLGSGAGASASDHAISPVVPEPATILLLVFEAVAMYLPVRQFRAVPVTHPTRAHVENRPSPLRTAQSI